ncbi:hypothetical protein SS50377_23886 [Spironucleus salmonicida]|uniref:Uncharacterized protein n=2 Tax=Spironucleus salmonicida TaxID=348837 RepID=V6LX51_9EUKA|nr:hypothetical protein SS50377_23884 [Spironucleus salmonicida]KAH0573951.1 hypothetical protein SS50377_23886 [Spironucleus salmonicida]|eukprot:EST48291.1 Hypothetical protein SS50377_11490 [Spironucleus salmonicida]
MLITLSAAAIACYSRRSFDFCESITVMPPKTTPVLLDLQSMPTPDDLAAVLSSHVVIGLVLNASHAQLVKVLGDRYKVVASLTSTPSSSTLRIPTPKPTALYLGFSCTPNAESQVPYDSMPAPALVHSRAMLIGFDASPKTINKLYAYFARDSLKEPSKDEIMEQVKGTDEFKRIIEEAMSQRVLEEVQKKLDKGEL